MKSTLVNEALQGLQLALINGMTAELARDFQPGVTTETLTTLNLVCAVERLLEEEGEQCVGYPPEGCTVVESKACDAQGTVCPFQRPQ